jgi:coproporphyrinogen III oxidase-like Fe-S oxidoreductase
VAGVEDLTQEAVDLEEVYLGLRTVDGLPADRLPPETVAAWTGAGWAVATPGRIRLTAEGWLRLDALAVATP